LYFGHTPIDVWIQEMNIDGDGGRREFGFRGQRRGTEVKREPPQIRSPAKEKSLPSKIRHGTADKPTVKRQVVNNSARAA
jgi:hypothetical protein